MLFRQRVSLQGALHVRRRACDKMAAPNTPPNTVHASQSLNRASLSFVALRTDLQRAYQPAFLPSQASSHIKDCRWKRGRPITFSGRAFSTKQADSNTEGNVVAVGSGIARQTNDHGEAVPHLPQPTQHLEDLGNTALSKQKGTCVEKSTAQPYHVRADYATDHSSSPEDLTTNVASPSFIGTHSVGSDDENTMASPECSTMEDVTDTDFLSSSADESGSQSERDDTEADDAVEKATEVHTPLEFQIPENVLRAAMAAPENTKTSFWSSNLYRGPDCKKILVHYCRTKAVAERVAQHFIGEKVVGFDIEWKPFSHPLSIKKNVSLVQLACENRIALFHIALFPGNTAAQLMPPTLKAILESPEIYKVGVAIKGDFSRVMKYLEVEAQGVFELSRLHNLVQFSATDPTKVTNKLVSLASQVQQHLQLPLYKGGLLVDDPDDTSNVRSSDWSLPLNPQQIHYAAADAYAGFRLYDTLEEKRKQLKPTPPRPLVCDYDSKPKPGSKRRKKRTAVTKTDVSENDAADESPALADQKEELREESQEESKLSQDTDGYETAQEDLLDSHQLEGEVSVSSEGSVESTDQSGDDDIPNPASLLGSEETLTPDNATQRRVGRINVTWLKGPDPAYPTLPRLSTSEDPSGSSDEDLVDISEDFGNERPHGNLELAETPKASETTSEFDDSELDEALQNLDIDSDGRLQDATRMNATTEAPTPPEAPGALAQSSVAPEATQALLEPKSEDDSPEDTASSSSASDEQDLLDLLNDPEVIEYLHTPAQLPLPPSAPAEPSLHTPEFDRATSWAHSYLASTIPSPSSRVPSHIRATIPHLRAYNMWRHQRLSVDEIARHLRDPPLPGSTVGSYVLQAITLERMEYDKGEVREVLMAMPEALRKGKWRGLAEKVDAR
ncbi:hypothetical protein C7974DRAFT_80765 [Boeremia exigua]|uniref:uncharacterized protein n=1 Tax=Boeremia exigua TaxID=749465 RepID=UPI001E8D5FAB|nr:uncharacterized protein C7974DRAFT_80765 [Boeremia exigua]KAH6612573.1 hypothetical protein C7974DRAFT_80765 [Boeremia exigua]